MNFEAIQKVNFTSKFSNFEVVNPEFTKCRCYALALGDNANGSDITMEAIDKAIARNEFYNKPIVAHLYRDEKTGGWRVGGHDSKVVISNEGIEIVNECIPFGTIPESANIHKEQVLEPDGVTYNTYLVMDVILWTGRYNIMYAAYNDEIYFNESCEITVNDGYYKDNGIFAINDFTFSCLCLLQKADDDTNVRPCFPSCRVEKIHSFSLNEEKFKQNFELMLEKLKSYESDVKPVQDINNFKEGDSTKTMNREKIVEALSNVTYENALGVAVGRYALVSLDDTTVGVIDRTDNKTYTVNYLQTDDGIVFNFDEAKECSLTTKEKEDTDFDYASEVSIAVTTAVDFAVKEKETEVETKYQNNIATELEKFKAQVSEATDKYAELKTQYDIEHAELEKYKAADEKRIADKHNADVEARFDKAAQKMGRVKEFLFYRADPKNREKSLEEIDADLMMIMGKAMLNQKQEFSYEPTVSGVQGIKISDNMNNSSRYGNLLSKFTQD